MNYDETFGIVTLLSNIRSLSNEFIEHELKQRGIKGIVPAHGAMLSFLFKQDNPVPIRAIVDHTQRAKSTITVTVNTLEKHGYLTKQPSDTDSRVICIALTDLGWEFKKDFMEISEKLVRTIYKGISKEKAGQLIELLNTVESNFHSGESK